MQFGIETGSMMNTICRPLTT